jgi:hypothetical protein
MSNCRATAKRRFDADQAHTKLEPEDSPEKAVATGAAVSDGEVGGVLRATSDYRSRGGGIAARCSGYYTEDDLRKLADPWQLSLETVLAEIVHLDAAARWLVMQPCYPEGWQPSKIIERLESIANIAWNLLAMFGVEGLDQSLDGPQDEQIARAFSIGMDDLGANEDDLRHALTGVADLTGWATRARDLLAAGPDGPPYRDTDALHSALRGVSPGNVGDEKFNTWLGKIAQIYARLTGKPATAAQNGFTRFAFQAATPLTPMLPRRTQDAIKNRTALKNRISRVLKIPGRGRGSVTVT